MTKPSTTRAFTALRLSLVAVWLLTGVISIDQWHGQSQALLHQMGCTDELLVNALIAAGAGVDLVLGLWLWLAPSRLVYGLCALGMVSMTVVATLGIPSLWLHPLGPLLKNLPIAAILWILWAHSS